MAQVFIRNVDASFMRHCPTPHPGSSRFAQILARRLGRDQTLRPGSGSQRTGAAPGDDSLDAGWWAVVELVPDTPALGRRCRAHYVPAQPAPVQPLRVLEPHQAAALSALQELGEDTLDSGFSGAELKASYRRLARRWHPDRAPVDTSDAEIRRLERGFNRLRESVSVLSPIA